MSFKTKLSYLRGKNMLTDKQKRKALKRFNDIVKSTTEDSFNKLMFKKYLQLKGSIKLANYLNCNGYRVKTESHIGERKYTTVDIYNFMLNEENQMGIDSRIIEVVTYLIKYVGRANWEQRVLFSLKQLMI